MIYQLPLPEEPLDQGDIIDGCPILSIAGFTITVLESLEVKFAFNRVVVLTQTCDLANQKVTAVNVAVVFDAQNLVDQHLFVPLLAYKQWHRGQGPCPGWACVRLVFPSAEQRRGTACVQAVALAEMIVDLRRLHTVRVDLLNALCQHGQRRARIQPLYREHLAKHFADTFSRIGLPEPYETA